MSITLGVFDIFTYAVPGSLYLALLVYISERFGWVDAAKILDKNTTLVLIAAATASYLIGHVSYVLGRAVGHSVRVWKKDIGDARREFILRVPAANGRAFVEADRALLQAVVEIRQQATALEIIRLRAVGLMLRNSAPAFTLGSMVAIGEIVASDIPGFAAGCSLFIDPFSRGDRISPAGGNSDSLVEHENSGTRILDTRNRPRPSSQQYSMTQTSAGGIALRRGRHDARTHSRLASGSMYRVYDCVMFTLPGSRPVARA